MAKVIKVENLSKAYQLGDFGTGTITRDFERFWARVRGKEDPFLRIGEVNDRTVKGESDVVWSLKDINFEIGQGDAVGIIGRNGAGKSTLLKILSRVTSPTTGSVKIKGRIASLLEVGTGFHPELTGRENIYLNGAILGMRKAEIKRKFDEIVDFSGVERYIDTPVKRYSSGMYVRLAFAVAAHLESEILIVDEVLAVGDAEFQKKCLGKMGEVSKGEGRTILFVSHNMASIQKLCNDCIILDNGSIFSKGSIHKCLVEYINIQKPAFEAKSVLDSNYSLPKITVQPSYINSLGEFKLSFTLTSQQERIISSLVPLIYNNSEERVAILDLRKHIGTNIRIDAGKELNFDIEVPSCPLIEGEYTLGLYIKDEAIEKDFLDIIKFNIEPQKGENDPYHLEYDPAVRGKVNFNFIASKSEIIR
ncbi:MAG TPA: ABC transporter ATP-binding protein [Mucilaginibacter sp.]|jgi:lipopolysaccharide transport system ATP-binding protein